MENSTALSQDQDQTESDNFSESNSLGIFQKKKVSRKIRQKRRYMRRNRRGLLLKLYRAFREGRPNLINAIWSDLLKKSYPDWFLQTIRDWTTSAS